MAFFSWLRGEKPKLPETKEELRAELASAAKWQKSGSGFAILPIDAYAKNARLKELFDLDTDKNFNMTRLGQTSNVGYARIVRDVELEQAINLRQPTLGAHGAADSAAKKAAAEQQLSGFPSGTEALERGDSKRGQEKS